MEPMLDVSNLSFDYLSASSCLPVIDNISFSGFLKGDFISIVGPSGCGKIKRFLDIIAGLMPSSAGQVFFFRRACHKTEKRKLDICCREISFLSGEAFFATHFLVLKYSIPPIKIKEKHEKLLLKCLLAMILAAFWVQSLLNYPAACARELLLFAH